MKELVILDIKKKLEHIKIRPTYYNINTVYILLKQHNFQNIPKISSFYTVNNNTIDVQKYCDKILEIINCDIFTDVPKPTKKTGVYMFQESSLLPKNVYLVENSEEKEIDDIILDSSSLSDSESDNMSEKETFEEGYELYESGNDDDFSD